MLNRHESSYKPHIIEKAKVTGEPTPKPYSKLANQLVNDVFQVNPLTKKPITIETGLREIEPQTVRKQLESEIGELVGLKTYGVDPESAEGKRIKTLTRPLLSAFTKNTYIKSLQADSYLGFVALSLDFAKDPQLLEHLSIQTGFGGSVDSNTNLRIPAYAIPAIHMVENIQKVLESQNLPVTLPTIRLAFAPHAAIAINGSQMPKEQVLENTAKNITYLSEYIHEFHPSIASKVKIEVDTPWDQHDKETKTTHNYFSKLLLETSDTTVSEALVKLQKLGMHHGGEEGKKFSSDYTAIHSFIFKDALEHPKDNFFPDSEKPLFSLSIGGRPERLFNVARGYIRRSARIEELTVQSNEDIQQQLESWRESLQNSRQTYGDTLVASSVHEGDKPLVSVAAITTIGSAPVYYATEYDLPVAQLSENPMALLEKMQTRINETKSGQEKSLAKDQIKIVVHDMKVMIDDVGGEDRFLQFVNKLQGKLYN